MKFILIIILAITANVYSSECDSQITYIFYCTGYDLESHSELRICVFPNTESYGLVLNIEDVNAKEPIDPFNGNFESKNVEVGQDYIKLKSVAWSLLYGSNWDTRVYIDLNDMTVFAKTEGTYAGKKRINFKCY